jgi:hypothetical protein
MTVAELRIDRGGRSEASEHTAAPWPEPPSQAAFTGLAGEIVETISPHSEADEAALLLQFLVAFGNAVGRGPHFVVEGDRHSLNLFALIVGATSKGRKGSSWGQVRRLFDAASPTWTGEHIKTGLSSGEGLVWEVRDGGEPPGRSERSGRTGSRQAMPDQGVRDKRLLILESEFASPLKAMGRDGNILSAVLRQAWDSGDLRTLAKNSPAKASGAHISVIGHVTAEELRRQLDRTEVANGFLNRFLLACVRRSKLLPEGGALTEAEVERMAVKVRGTADAASEIGVVSRDEAATALWKAVYPALSSGRPGLLGAVTSRAEAQTMRLACIYSTLDQSNIVRASHLRSALAVWEFCENSARFIFGDALGDPVADELLRALRATPDGMTRTQIRDHFNGHGGKSVGRALASLTEFGLVSRRQMPSSGGRPAERWVATDASEATEGLSGKRLSSLMSLSSPAERGDAWEPEG